MWGNSFVELGLVFLADMRMVEWLWLILSPELQAADRIAVSS